MQQRSRKNETAAQCDCKDHVGFLVIEDSSERLKSRSELNFKTTLLFIQENCNPSIQSPIPSMTRFSVREMNPRGTLESPPTQAHFNSRFSM